MKVDRVSTDTKVSLVVLAGRQHTWVFSEPDEDGLREVYLDGKEEGKGDLLGSVMPIASGYMTQSSDVEVGRYLGVEFPDRPKSNCVLISTTVTAIIVMVMAKKEVAAVSS